MLLRTDRLVIAVPDLERAQREMVGVLGRSPAWTGGYPADALDCVSFRLDNLDVELLSPGHAAAANQGVGERLERYGAGLHALVLESDDLAQDIATLRARGLGPPEPVACIARDESSGAYRRFLRCELALEETAGIRLQLVQPLDAIEERPPSLPIQDPAASVTRGDHVVVSTHAPERAIDLFGGALGIRLALDRTFEQRKTRLIFFRLGGFTIEIANPLVETSEGSVPDDRLWGVAYAVADIDAAAERIRDAGLEITDFRDGNKPGTRVFTILGKPAGVPTLVIQHLKQD